MSSVSVLFYARCSQQLSADPTRPRLANQTGLIEFFITQDLRLVQAEVLDSLTLTADDTNAPNSTRCGRLPGTEFGGPIAP